MWETSKRENDVLIGVDETGFPWIATKEKPELPSAGWWNNLRTPDRGGYSSKMIDLRVDRDFCLK